MSYKNVREAYITREHFGDTDSPITRIKKEGGAFSPGTDMLCHWVLEDPDHPQDLHSYTQICRPVLISPEHAKKYLFTGALASSVDKSKIEPTGKKYKVYLLGVKDAPTTGTDAQKAAARVADFNGLISVKPEDLSQGYSSTS